MRRYYPEHHNIVINTLDDLADYLVKYGGIPWNVLKRDNPNIVKWLNKHKSLISWENGGQGGSIYCFIQISFRGYKFNFSHSIFEFFNCSIHDYDFFKYGIYDVTYEKISYIIEDDNPDIIENDYSDESI